MKKMPIAGTPTAFMNIFTASPRRLAAMSAFMRGRKSSPSGVARGSSTISGAS